MTLADKVSEVIAAWDAQSGSKQLELVKKLAEMKKAGIIKTPSYNFPLVDTIGKQYYSSLNKR